jgi:hypothetical protein
MARETDTGAGMNSLRRLAVPAAVGVVGSAVGLLLTKKPKSLREAIPNVRDAIPQLPEGGIGELTDDLRGRLDSVLGRGDGDEVHDRSGWAQSQPANFDASRFEKRRAERGQRREQRRRRTTT